MTMIERILVLNTSSVNVQQHNKVRLQTHKKHHFP
jgi:hypothetical protein